MRKNAIGKKIRGLATEAFFKDAAETKGKDV